MGDPLFLILLQAFDHQDSLSIHLTPRRCNKRAKSLLSPPTHRTTRPVHDQDLHQTQHLIEDFFARLKPFRAIATRYDKRATNFLGAIYLAASMTCLN